MLSLCTGMLQALEPNRQPELTATGAKGMERNAIDSCGDKWIFIQIYLCGVLLTCVSKEGCSQVRKTLEIRTKLFSSFLSAYIVYYSLLHNGLFHHWDMNSQIRSYLLVLEGKFSFLPQEEMVLLSLSHRKPLCSPVDDQTIRRTVKSLCRPHPSQTRVL